MLAVTATGCRDDAGVTSATKYGTNRVELPTAPSPSLDSRTTGVATSEFHSRNYADWVGKAHNKLLDDFFKKIISEGGPKNLCVEFEAFMNEAGREVPGQPTESAEMRRRLARMAVQRSGICGRELSASSTTVIPAAMRSHAALANVDDISQATTDLANQVESLAAVATDAEQLAASLNPLLTQADQLPNGEAAIVYATASVAQSSFEYWQANLWPLSDELYTVYSPCLGQYTDEDVGLYNCMGVGVASGPVTPTRLKVRYSDKTVLTLTSLMQTRVCDMAGAGSAIVEADVTGAFGGAVAGFFLGGPGGALGGGAAAGLGSSWGNSLFHIGKQIYCILSGGRPPSQRT
jgi:hypothetical protein